MNNRRVALAAVLTAGLGFQGMAQAQDWVPGKAVRIVVPISGSTNDTLARLVAPKLSEALGQPVIVENKPGAGGNIGSNFVAKSEPDGYTLLVGYNGPMAINPTLFKSMPFDPLKDLAPITIAMKGAQYLVVNPAAGINSVNELVQNAKKNPNKFSYASVAVGSASHLTMEMLKMESGANLTHVPYKGAGEAIAGLISGDVQAAFFVPGNVQEFARDGRVKLIASTGRTRYASTPDVPTMIELGYKDFEATVWAGFYAPAATPRRIIDRYNRELVKILNSPEVGDKLRQIEYEVVTSTPEDFRNWNRLEIQRWGKIIKATGARID
ncbi:MAG: tripartite tricarboxylate transporter substrate binding protein [Pseudomonadota bacterium]